MAIDCLTLGRVIANVVRFVEFDELKGVRLRKIGVWFFIQ